MTCLVTEKVLPIKKAGGPNGQTQKKYTDDYRCKLLKTPVEIPRSVRLPKIVLLLLRVLQRMLSIPDKAG